MIPTEDQEPSTVRQTPDSVTLPSPAELIVRSSYRRGSQGLNSLRSREKAERSSSVVLSDRSAATWQYTPSRRQAPSQKRLCSPEKINPFPPPKKNRGSSGRAPSGTPSSTTQSRPRRSRADGNAFYLIREQLRAGRVGSDGPRGDSVSLASSQPKDLNSQSTSCYSSYEETVQMTREWIRMGSTVEEPQPRITPRDKPISRTASGRHSQRSPASSQSPAPARMDSALVPALEGQPGGTGPLQGDTSAAPRRSDPATVLLREPSPSSPTARCLLNDSESQLSLVGSRRSPTVLSPRDNTPSAFSVQTRPIHTRYLPPDSSSGPRIEREQKRRSTDLPFFNSEDDLFGDNTSPSSPADVADSRFMTPIVTERQAHHSVQSVLSDAITSQVGSSASGIDDTYLEELAKGGRWDRHTTPARRKREAGEARKRARSPGYWRRRQEEEDAEIAEMAREEGRSKLSEPRAKLPWSLKETRRLVRLWEKHPNEWARIERLDGASDDPRLTNRTQVDLKDKMRNVKTWMLKNGIQLPEKWARIMLTTAQKRAVAIAYRDGVIPRSQGGKQGDKRH